MTRGDTSHTSHAREAEILLPWEASEQAPVNVVRLSGEQVDRLAVRIAAELERSRREREALVTVQELAERLRVGPGWIYRNWRELGGFKLGGGARSPIRFTRAEIEKRWGS